MIGVIYTIDLLEQKEKKINPMASTTFLDTSIDDVISLFPDFNKRLHDFGKESH